MKNRPLTFILIFGGLILGILIFFSSCEQEKALVAEENKEKSTVEWDKIRLLNLKEYNCFSWFHTVEAKHEWENNYVDEENPYMLIRKDTNGVLIAQPDPDARFGEENIDYWIRTVEFSDWWIRPGLKVVKCPEGLTKSFIDNHIKKNYSREFTLD